MKDNQLPELANRAADLRNLGLSPRHFRGLVRLIGEIKKFEREEIEADRRAAAFIGPRATREQLRELRAEQHAREVKATGIVRKPASLEAILGTSYVDLSR